METSQNLRWNLQQMETRFDCELEKIGSFFHLGDQEKTWIIDNHQKEQHSQWKALGEIYTKITPTERLTDLKYLVLDNIWIMKHEGNCQEWHNTTSKDKVERIALWNARRRILELLKTKHVLSTMFILEYSLTDLNSEKNLEEQLKNEKNPWRTTM